MFCALKGLAHALPRSRCEPSASPSRRDRPIVAWHEVPGKPSSKDPSRRVRYDRARLMRFSIDSCVHLKESHRTLRDGSFGVMLSQALRAWL